MGADSTQLPGEGDWFRWLVFGRGRLRIRPRVGGGLQQSGLFQDFQAMFKSMDNVIIMDKSLV